MTSAHEIHAEFRSTLGKFTLEAVFTVPATGITMLFGPSGCGKTTVLRCIAGLIHIKDGLCDIAGEVWQARSGAFVPTHKRALGYVFQEASLFPISPCEKISSLGLRTKSTMDRPSTSTRSSIC
jgi:molybdate transport system ATP-binding protein